MVVNFVIPLLLQPVGPRKLLLSSWILTLAGLILLERMSSADDYWRLGLPGIILYIAGIGTMYFVGNVTVVATASEEYQGTASGVYNVRTQLASRPPCSFNLPFEKLRSMKQMFLNVGGAVLGVALLTVVDDSVTLKEGGPENARARLAGYRAGYHGALAMAVLGLVISFFFSEAKAWNDKQQHKAETQEATANITDKEKSSADDRDVPPEQKAEKRGTRQTILIQKTHRITTDVPQLVSCILDLQSPWGNGREERAGTFQGAITVTCNISYQYTEGEPAGASYLAFTGFHGVLETQGNTVLG